MARRRRKASARPWLLVAVLVAVAAIGWTQRQRLQALLGGHGTPAPAAQGTVEVSAAQVDLANDGRHVRASGNLEANAPPRDTELGVSAKGAVLLRRVEMYQWHESCAGDDCRYAAEWSERPIDSRRFRHGEGHDNPLPRLASARFAAGGLRFGGYTVGADLVSAQATASDLPVHAAELPPNLAASFADAGGFLYAGGDPAHPKIGELRISYRLVPLGPAVLNGVQHGSALAAE